MSEYSIKDINTTNSILNPLIADIHKISIKEYLETNDFENIIFKNNVNRKWKIIQKEISEKHITMLVKNKKIEVCEEVFYKLLDILFSQNRELFSDFILSTLDNFIGCTKEKIESNEIFNDLFKLRIAQEKIDTLRAKNDQKTTTKDHKKKTKIINRDKSKIFIVHGQDEAAKLDVARFVETMNLEAIILHEQVSEGMTIIEKIEKYSDVGFGIVLYTPCDVGASKDKTDNLQPRARQNVVFEHGYLMARLGRKNVCALKKDKVEVPSDMSGILYITMDENKAWKINLAKEIKNSGYSVDMNSVI